MACERGFVGKIPLFIGFFRNYGWLYYLYSMTCIRSVWVGGSHLVFPFGSSLGFALGVSLGELVFPTIFEPVNLVCIYP